ncbi:MAG: hypothetical protein IH819_06015 [Bacteroidetes bacterium]|nr:hypothetical protein [Bacteroidota bacterium]
MGAQISGQQTNNKRQKQEAQTHKLCLVYCKFTAFRAEKDKISFNFDITHSGRGDVFKEGDADSPAADCPRDPRERRQKENKVFVAVDTGIPNLKCVGFSGGTSGFVTLVDGRRGITCAQELDPGRNDFETNVEITADFNYRDNVEQEVLVKHLLDT